MKMFSFLMPSISALRRAGSSSSPWPRSAVKVTTSRLIGLLQPLQDDRRVEAARVGEHDLFHLARGAVGGHGTHLVEVAKVRAL